jgi:hypothetical protein
MRSFSAEPHFSLSVTSIIILAHQARFEMEKK